MTVVEKFVDTPSGKIHLRTAGSGPALVAVHGVLSSSRSFDSLLAWADAGGNGTVVAIDLPGYGKSECDADFVPGWVRYAQVVEQVADGLGLHRFHLVGHSMGGGICVCVADQMPARVERLCLIDTPASTFPLPFKARIPQVPVIGDVVFRLMYRRRLFYTYFKNDVYYDASKLDRDRLEEYYSAFNLNRKNALAAVRASASCTEVDTRLSDIVCPTLVLWGQYDPLIPLSIGQFISERIRDSRLEIIPDCGHAPLEESPALALERLECFFTVSG